MPLEEEVVQLVPQVQTFEVTREELVPVVRQEFKAVPKVSMEYKEKRVEVGWKMFDAAETMAPFTTTAPASAEAPVTSAVPFANYTPLFQSASGGGLSRGFVFEPTTLRSSGRSR